MIQISLPEQALGELLTSSRDNHRNSINQCRNARGERIILSNSCSWIRRSNVKYRSQKVAMRRRQAINSLSAAAYHRGVIASIKTAVREAAIYVLFAGTLAVADIAIINGGMA